MENQNIYSLHAEADTVHLVAAKQKQVCSRTALHWHDCCELELVLCGQGTHIINGHHYTIGPGDLYCFTPADCHMIIADEPIEVLGIMFGEELISDDIFARMLTLGMTGSDLRVSLEQDRYPIVEQYFSTILREEAKLSDSSLAEAYIGRLIDCILIELLRAMGETALPRVKQAANAAIMYLHRHYAEPITLQSLSNHLYLTPSYLSTYFKNSTGRNFKDYLTELRLRHACRLLSNTDISITDVCYGCGFTSYSNFMRSFRTHYQTSPLQFRREHQAITVEKPTNIRKDNNDERNR